MFLFFGINKLTETLFCLAYKYDDIATLSELLSIEVEQQENIKYVFWGSFRWNKYKHTFSSRWCQ